MPSAWKKAKLGGIPRLLASALDSPARRGVGDSPLVLQAGFPTSVADLIVKNHGRLKKKAARWLRRHPRPGEAEAACSTTASLVSEILGAVASADPASTPVSPPRPAEREQKQEEEQRSPLAAGVETSRDAISEEGLKSSRGEEEEETREAEGSASEASTRPEPAKTALGASKSRGIVLLAKVMFPVFVLAIGTREIALGVSISAFAILLLESMGSRLIPPPKPREESKKIVPVSSSNGRVPTKNSTAAFCERTLELKAPVEVTAPAAQSQHPALEPKDHVEAEGRRRDQKEGTSNKKAKKLLRKFVPRKLRGAKGERGGKPGAKAEPASDPSGNGVSSQRGEGEAPLEEEEDCGAGDVRNKDEQEKGGGVPGFEVPAGVRDVGPKDAAFLGEDVGEPTKGSSGHLVFFLIVLSGLVGGRAVAMVLTVVWYSLASSARSLWKSWKTQQQSQGASARCFHFGSFKHRRGGSSFCMPL